MTTVAAVISMLHEGAERNSATRIFRGQSVLEWTLKRLSQAATLESTVVLCWEDQFQAVGTIAEKHGAAARSKGARILLPAVQGITAARRWADGWRGGLAAACDFDQGFYGPWVQEACAWIGAEAVVLVDPAAGLIDPKLVDAIVAHAEAHGELDLCFSQAAPGLAPALLRREFLERLAKARSHPGQILYHGVDRFGVDPISSPACLPVAAPLARTLNRFKLDSDRQITRLTAATTSLNGQLLATSAEELVHRMDEQRGYDAMPREVVLELTTQRASCPVFWPGRYLASGRPAMPRDMLRAVLGQLGQVDDVRLTLGGVGDPLLEPQVFDAIEAARAAGIEAIHVETDLLSTAADDLVRLARAAVDVISVSIPATTPGTYQALMGVAGLEQVVENLRLFLEERARRGQGIPLVAPVFLKCRQNMAEMEAWYDQWVKALGGAVIAGPSDYAGQIADTAVVDMAPPRRQACYRLRGRMCVLSDGRVVSCEQDVLGKQVLGQVSDEPIGQIWQRVVRMHAEHAAGRWSNWPLCAACRQWHRP